MALTTTAALALMATAAAAQAYNTNRVAKKQDNIAAAGIRKQSETQRQVNDRLKKTLDDTAASNPDASRKKADSDYLMAIRQKLGEGTAGLQQRGVSSEYDIAAGGAAKDASAYAGNIGDLLSRIDSGTMQRQNEANMVGDFGFDVSPLAGNVAGDDFLTQLMMGNVRRNPYIDAAAGAAKGAASGGYGAK